jgi:sulfhydrogenase subunit delta
MKPKIAIFDLTDCEGCELEFINLREKIIDITENADIANWRLASDTHDTGPFDITFIEGSPISEADIEIVKQARAASRVVVSLGSCADLGGIQASIASPEREKGIKAVYGEKYKRKSKKPKPISYYIEVDYHLPGCPINKEELAKFLASLLVLKAPESVRYPVCLECKARENNCLYLEGEPCLGPITKGGCDAVCPSRGLRCWGCFGELEGANTAAFKKNLAEKVGGKRSKVILDTFQKDESEEYVRKNA